MRRLRHTSVLVLCAALAGLSCDEALPPRVDPEVVLVPGIDLSSGLVRVESGRVTSGGSVLLSMQNAYDEVLSEEALVKGTLTMYLREYPDSVRTLAGGQSELVTQGLVIGNTLTLRVKAVAVMALPWDHRTSAGTPFWELGMRFTEKVTDKGVPYLESEPVHLVVRASFQLFKRVQAARIPSAEYTITYQLWQMPPPTLAKPSL